MVKLLQTLQMKKLLVLLVAVALASCALDSVETPTEQSPLVKEALRTRAVVDSLRKSPPVPPFCVWNKNLKAAEEAAKAATEAVMAEVK